MLTPTQRLESWRLWALELEAGRGREAARGPFLDELLALASEQRGRAHSPYSKLALGAVLLGVDGRLFGGCNVENASYGLTNCAERCAVFHGLAEGQRQFLMCFLQGQEPDPIAPCGACRQVLHEFAPRLWVLSRGSSGRMLCSRVDQLLPGAMGAADLPRG